MNKLNLKQQLQYELAELRQRVADLEAQERKRKRIVEALRESEEKLTPFPTPYRILFPCNPLPYYSQTNVLL